LSINERVAELLYSSEHTVLSDIIHIVHPPRKVFMKANEGLAWA